MTKFTRIIDGVPAMTVTEHEWIVSQLVAIIEGLVENAEPDCGDPSCKECKVWRPAWRAIQELKEEEHMISEPVECMCGVCKLGKREWIGLTDEEVHQGFCHVEYETPNDWNTDPDDWCQQFARYLEAKLKEKNT